MGNHDERYLNQIEKSRFLTEICTTQYESVDEKVIEYVLAPAINSFVVWVLDEAIKKGVKRLYFLARDAYFMYKMAVIYVEKYNLPIECRYLYCSRYSVRIPIFCLNQSRALDYITLGGLSVTPERILQRTGFSEKEIDEFLKENEFLSFERNEEIPRGRLGEIKKLLSRHEAYKEKAESISKKALNVFDTYLVQEGFKDNVKMAVVDSGWVGSMQKVLNENLLRINAPQRLEGFYWGLYDIPDGVDRAKYHTYFFSPEGDIKKKTYFNNCLFEAVFTAPHGMTVGYESKTQKNGAQKIIPRLSEVSDSKAAMIKKYGAIFGSYAKKIANHDFNHVKDELLSNKTKEIIENNIKLFMHHPSKEETIFFGNLDFTDDVVESKNGKIATYLTEKELKDNHFSARVINEIFKHIVVKQSAWYEGSAVLYGNNPDVHIFRYTVYKYFMYVRKAEEYKNKINGKCSDR